MSVAIKLAQATEKSDGSPSPEQLVLINQYTLKSLASTDVYVRKFIVSHTALDRDKEIISDGLLKDIGDTLAGKGLFIKHPMSFDGDTGPGIGKWFETEVITLSLDDARKQLGEVEFAPEATTAKILYASAYIARTDKHANTIADIDAGVISFVSASFSYSDQFPIEKDGEVMGSMLSGKGEAHEASLVWLGAQPGARAIKAANPNQPNTGDDMSKELETKIKTLNTEKDGLQTQLTTEKAAKENAETKLKAFTDVLGDHSPEAVKGFIALQTTAKNAVIDSLVAFDRNAKTCGDDDAAIKAATTKYTVYPFDALQQLNAANKAANPANGKGITGGDPNHQDNNNDDNNALKECPI